MSGRLVRSFAVAATVLCILSAIPAHATPVTPVPAGATWKYFAGPAEPAGDWRGPGFDDSAWSLGSALLGYGEPYVVTGVPYGPSASNKWPTTYFRVVFDVTDDPVDVRAMWVDANYDDGFVAYLNGTEVVRASMPAGAVAYTTLAQSHESGAFERFDLSAMTGILQAGSNVLAVEVHQTSASSSDLALDMSLTYSSDSVRVVRGPYLQIAKPTAITVRWRTDVASGSTVRYGATPASLTSVAGDAAPVTEHEVTLVGLTPGTRYYYSVGTPGSALAGDSSHSFRTPPPHGTTALTRWWIIGDSGQGNSNARRVYDAYRGRPEAKTTDFWLMLGDNAYNTGTDAEYQIGVFDTYPEFLRSLPLWPTRGNHDHLHAGPNNDYYDIFSMPTDGSAGGVPSGTEAYYSFNHANVHFICLDSEGSDRSVGGAMLQWLRADLAATTQAWTVVFFHHPPYSKGSHDSDVSGGGMRDMRENVLPILDSTGVDLVLAGHSHAYERSFLINGHYGTSETLTNAMRIDDGDGRVAGDGAYVKPTAGKGPFEGAIYTVAGSSAQTSGGTLDHPIMVTSLNVLGSVIVEVESLAMHVRFLDDQAVVRDSFTIVKGATADVPRSPSATLSLSPAKPNPSATTMQIGYALATTGSMRLSVIDVHGRRIATLVDGVQGAGSHRARWDGLDAAGQSVAPGVYYALLEQNGERRAAPLVRVK